MKRRSDKPLNPISSNDHEKEKVYLQQISILQFENRQSNLQLTELKEKMDLQRELYIKLTRTKEMKQESKRKFEEEQREFDQIISALEIEIDQSFGESVAQNDGKELIKLISPSDFRNMTKQDENYLVDIQKALQNNQISEKDSEIAILKYKMAKKLRKGARQIIQLYKEIHSSGQFTHSCSLSCYLDVFFDQARSGQTTNSIKGPCSLHSHEITISLHQSVDNRNPIPSKMSNDS